MYMKLLILRKTNSYAKFATSFLAKVACKMCSFLTKHFSAKKIDQLQNSHHLRSSDAGYGCNGFLFKFQPD